jgi:prepilin peptidase CpaA
MQANLAFAVPVAIFMAVCAIIDYRTKRIPNWLTVPTAVLGLVYSALAPQGIGILWSLAGFAVGMSLLILPWILGGGGMGDVKMLAALGAWLGPLGILVAFGLGSFLAMIGMMGVLTMSMMSQGLGVTRKRYLAAGAEAAPVAPTRKVRRVLPFAVPMAISTWLLLAWMAIRVAG